MEKNSALEFKEGYLCLVAEVDSSVIRKHAPLGNKIIDFKRVKEDCNIIHEDCFGFPEDSKGNSSNIYCLDDNFQLKWRIDVPLYGNCFPNPIRWYTKMDKKIESKGNLNLTYVTSPEVFTCTDWRGIEYDSGKTLEAELTK